MMSLAVVTATGKGQRSQISICSFNNARNLSLIAWLHPMIEIFYETHNTFFTGWRSQRGMSFQLADLCG